MKYFILEKKEIIPTVSDIKDTDLVENKRIDLNNLSQSTGCSSYLFDIPPEKQKELNEKGETSFTILITRTIIIEQH